MKRILTLIVCAVSLNAVGQVPNYLPYNPDFDGDSWIGINDLLNVLSVYAAEWENGELLLNSDTTSALLFVGELYRHECYSACIGLEGQWSVAEQNDFMAHTSSLESFYNKPMLMMSSEYGSRDGVWTGTGDWKLDARSLQGSMSEDGLIVSSHPFSTNVVVTDPLNQGLSSYDRNEFQQDCWCSTVGRPRAEYSVVDAGSGTWNEILNSMAEEGWLLLPQGPFGNQITFWRWAD